MNFPPYGGAPRGAYSGDTAKDIASHIFDEYGKLRNQKPPTPAPAPVDPAPAPIAPTPEVSSDFGMIVSHKATFKILKFL